MRRTLWQDASQSQTDFLELASYMFRYTQYSFSIKISGIFNILFSYRISGTCNILFR